MGTYLLSEIGGNLPLSRFLGFWSVMGNALFAYIGTELVRST
jgi:yeast amino acid transporter